MPVLTPRELQVLQLIAHGRSTKQLASDLGISFKTAVAHRTHLLSKLSATNTADLVCRAMRAGWIDSHPVPPSLAERAAAAREKHRRELEKLESALLQSVSLRQECRSIREAFAAVRHETRNRAQRLLQAVHREHAPRPLSSRRSAADP